MAKSIKVNFAFNLINTVVGLLFPIITFPYITRVVMAGGIGKVNFLYSIISYLALFCAIGIPVYAVREISRVRDDIRKRNQTSVEILLLHLLLTLVGYAIVFIIAFSVSRVRQDFWLFILLSSHLLLSAVGVAWFYQAIEEFKYITILSLAVRVIVLVSLFLFVKDKDDLYAYAAITILSEVGNYAVNFFHLRKYFRLKDIDWKALNLRRHVKPSLKIFVLNLITSIYVNLDSVMLGFLSSDAAVGFYYAAVRITKAILGAVGSLGSVLLPRLSNYVATGETLEFERVSRKAMNIIVTMTIPMSMGLFFIAPQFIPIFCGDSFLPSVLTLRIVSPIIIFLGLSNMAGLQILYPQGQEILVIKSTLIGALVNVLLNALLIPRLAQDGAAIGTVFAEFSVTATMLIIGRKYIPYSILSRKNLIILCFSFLVCLPVLLIREIPASRYVVLCLEIIIPIILYGLFLKYSRNESYGMIVEPLRRIRFIR